jgi:hypothetical protein
MIRQQKARTVMTAKSLGSATELKYLGTTLAYENAIH